MTETNIDRKQPSTTTERAFNKKSTLTKDDLFHLLQNERRRLVLWYLTETDGPVEMRDIAEQVAAWEYDTTVQHITSPQRQRVYISLYQTHLSKLADFGLIIYNQDRGIVERTPLADQVTPYLTRDNTPDRLTESETKWVQYYVGVTTFSTLLIGIVWMGFGSIPLFSLSNIGLPLIITLLYTGVTIAMVADDRRSNLLQAITVRSSDGI